MKTRIEELGFVPTDDFLPIQKGGSARSFFRFTDAQKGACVFCEYSAEKEENFLYAPIAEFLRSCGVSVPKIYFHDSAKRILVMEDLGVCDLLDFSKSASAEDVERAYEAALLELAKIHSAASAEFAKSSIKLMPKFDDALYTWEQNYFYDNLVRGFFVLDVPKPADEWAALRVALVEMPECLLHRDFQSQNVIVRGSGSVGLIDFQGMRLGVLWYDLASMLYDPYADMSPALRTKLFNYYCEIRGVDSAESAPPFFKAAAERLMQALGAFAFLSLQKGKREYIGHIPAALRLLKECALFAGLPQTLNLAELCEKSLADNPHFCEFQNNAK